jgi:outer membrane lipoprotein carrier protein
MTPHPDTGHGGICSGGHSFPDPPIDRGYPPGQEMAPVQTSSWKIPGQGGAFLLQPRAEGRSVLPLREGVSPAQNPQAGVMILLLAFTLLLPVSVSRAAGTESAGEALLRRVAERYASARTLSAKFRQEIPLQNVGIVRKASGTVYFGRPLKMRWDYDGPEAQLFLADGRYFYFRPAGSSQVIRRAVDEKGLGGKIPLLLLFGKGEITDLFRVDAADPRKGGEETVLRLSPLGDGAPEVRRIDLVVGTEDALIREIHVFDRLGGENHLYLTDVKVNPPLPAGFFRFRKPAGVSVVDG